MSKMGRIFQEMRLNYDLAMLEGRIDTEMLFSDWVRLEKATVKINKTEEE
tara:strand:- start:473 stop:622 length:150 start_codon:yes stop_codon:yes gene_type:complete